MFLSASSIFILFLFLAILFDLSYELNKTAYYSLRFRRTSRYIGVYRYYLVQGFNQINRLGYWWTSTNFGTSIAYEYYLRFDETNIYREYSSKNCGYSVRCIKN